MKLFCDCYNSVEEQKKCKLKVRCEKQHCNEFCARCYTFNYMLQLSGISGIYLKGQKLKPSAKDLESFRRLKLIKENIVEWTEGANSLCIRGGCGNGKTSWATKLLLNYIADISEKGMGADALIVTVSELLSSYKDSIGANENLVGGLENRIINADLVVFDDIASDNYSPFDLTKLFKIINARVNEGKSTIYTTNIQDDVKLKATLGARLYSRIIENSEIITLVGGDRRAKSELWQPRGN